MYFGGLLLIYSIHFTSTDTNYNYPYAMKEQPHIMPAQANSPWLRVVSHTMVCKSSKHLHSQDSI